QHEPPVGAEAHPWVFAPAAGAQLASPLPSFFLFLAVVAVATGFLGSVSAKAEVVKPTANSATRAMAASFFMACIN
ncbi:MAG: hypothetical protein ACO3BA_08630, partial [Schleiferiaceae bacterium]